MSISKPDAILITGANGFLGSLVAATALAETDATLVLPVRAPHTREDVLAPLIAELSAEGRAVTDADLGRVVTLPLPPLERFGDLVPTLREHRVTDILHCAGCLSYFNVNKLQAGNIDLTNAVLSLGAALDVRRFVYLSTAYSSGFTEALIPESLHVHAGMDPTDYTRTKREAEHLVAASGLPYVIVRPSIVVGDSRDGRYGGKPYGVYQLWTAGERYLSENFPPVLHVIAADKSLNFLHQDAFKTGFWAAYRELPDGSVMHLVSRDDELPSMRDLWKLWMSTNGGPREVHLYSRMEDVPMDEVDPQLRLWLDFTAVNNGIASVRWNFARDTLERLRREGMQMQDATLKTLTVAQHRFIADSPKLQCFVGNYQRTGTRTPRIVVHEEGLPAASGERSVE